MSIRINDVSKVVAKILATHIHTLLYTCIMDECYQENVLTT